MGQIQSQTSYLIILYLGFLIRKMGIIMVLSRRIVVRIKRINICKVLGTMPDTEVLSICYCRCYYCYYYLIHTMLKFLDLSVFRWPLRFAPVPTRPSCPAPRLPPCPAPEGPNHSLFFSLHCACQVTQTVDSCHRPLLNTDLSQISNLIKPGKLKAGS